MRRAFGSRMSHCKTEKEHLVNSGHFIFICQTKFLNVTLVFEKELLDQQENTYKNFGTPRKLLCVGLL